MLKDKLENALNETRTLILGAEVLLGFEYQSVFQTGFEKLEFGEQALKILGLALMLVAIALLIAPAAFHRLALDGEETEELNRFTTRMAAGALFPFAAAFSVEAFIAFRIVRGQLLGLFFGAVFFLLAIFFWYGLELLDRVRRGRPGREMEKMSSEKQAAPEGTPLRDKIKQALTETRIVLPGIQALLGFQFATILIEGFEKLPPGLKDIHLAGLFAIALSTMLLMAPAAYHRIVEQGEDSEHFLRFTSRMLLAGMALLAVGIAADFYIVVEKVLQSAGLALAAAILALLLYWGLWFGYCYLRRLRSPRAESA